MYSIDARFRLNFRDYFFCFACLLILFIKRRTLALPLIPNKDNCFVNQNGESEFACVSFFTWFVSGKRFLSIVKSKLKNCSKLLKRPCQIEIDRCDYFQSHFYEENGVCAEKNKSVMIFSPSIRSVCAKNRLNSYSVTTEFINNRTHWPQ